MKFKLKFFSIALLSTLIVVPFYNAYATHDDFVVGGIETTGAARGPVFQIFGLDNTLRRSQLVLNANFISDFQLVQDVRAGGAVHEKILVCARETTGLARGPAFELWDRDGTRLVTRFALNPDFSSLHCDAVDIDGDGIEEITTVGVEVTGASRGWAIQVWDQSGNLLFTRFMLNRDFRNSPLFIESGRD